MGSVDDKVTILVIFIQVGITHLPKHLPRGSPSWPRGFFGKGEHMKVEILCNGCDDCEVIQGRVCQALADLNLKASVVSHHNPQRHAPGMQCDGKMKLLINGIPVSARNDCSVRDLMMIFSTESHMQAQDAGRPFRTH